MYVSAYGLCVCISACMCIYVYIPYFLDYKMHFPPKIWEENGSASYSLKVAYPAGDSGAAVEWVFFSHFPPLKPRYVLWSGTSYSPKNMVHIKSVNILESLY